LIIIKYKFLEMRESHGVCCTSAFLSVVSALGFLGFLLFYTENQTN